MTDKTKEPLLEDTSQEAHSEGAQDEMKPGGLGLGGISLGLRMRLVNAIFAIGIIAFTVITHLALQVQLTATDELIQLNEAEEYAQDADRLHDGLRGDLYAALLAPGLSDAEGQELLSLWQSEIARFRDDLAHQGDLSLPPEVKQNVSSTRERAEEFLFRTEDLMQRAKSERASVLAQLPNFEERFAELGETFDSLKSLLSEEILTAKSRALAARDEADRTILLAAIIIILCSMALIWTITRSIRGSVRHVAEVARSLANGDLDVRYERRTSGEVGAIGASLNAMAESLERTLTKMRSDSVHDKFSKQLAEALEIADTEPDIARIIARAMRAISSEHPMELLLTDGDGVRLRRAAENPDSGPPACTVDVLARCPAVRRGSTARYPDSERLNACPQLQGRAAGRVSAICVPLNFMGKSLGVVHATGPINKPLHEDDVVDLEALALHAATRTGTVRAFRRTQTQALTDSLTGLLNRRALETEVGELLRGGGTFCVVMADLDRFKALNDSFGHQAGDKALQLFADLVKACMRTDDRAARWGGEEFVVILNGTESTQAVKWVDRVRAQLEERCDTYGGPAFTASFGIADSSMWPDFAGLLRIADAALYVSKTEGRDQATVGTPDSALAAEDDDGAGDGRTGDEPPTPYLHSMI